MMMLLVFEDVSVRSTQNFFPSFCRSCTTCRRRHLRVRRIWYCSSMRSVEGVTVMSVKWMSST